MNKTLLAGKLLNIDQSGSIYVYTLGIMGRKDIVSFISKLNKQELIESYIYVEAFLTERDGYTAAFATLIQKQKTIYGV